MFRNVRSGLPALAAAGFLALGCQSVVGVRADPTPVAFDVLNEQIEIYDGQTVVVRGYLKPLLGRLVLYRDSAAADIGNHFDEGILIDDTSPDRILRLEGRYYKPTCTQAMVEIAGTIAPLNPLGYLGIADIQSIDLMAGEDGDQTRPCYSAADSTIYAPEEI